MDFGHTSRDASETSCQSAEKIGRKLHLELTQLEQQAAVIPLCNDHLSLEVQRRMDRALADLEPLGRSPAEIRSVSARFWQSAEETLRRGSLQVHAREKPLGYAGDYLLFDRICRMEVRGEGTGAALDRYFLAHGAPQAVRNRTSMVANQIATLCAEQRSGVVEIVSLGSGPGWDIRKALQQLSPDERHRLHFTAIDFDPRALDFIVAWWNTEFGETIGSLQTYHVNLRRFDRWLKVPENYERLSRARYIFCTGFLDYISDVIATEILQAITEKCPDHCDLDFFAFGSSNPSRAYMEWIGDWFVIHRSKDQLATIAQEIGLQRFDVLSEHAGINLLLRGRKF